MGLTHFCNYLSLSSTIHLPLSAGSSVVTYKHTLAFSQFYRNKPLFSSQTTPSHRPISLLLFTMKIPLHQFLPSQFPPISSTTSLRMVRSGHLRPPSCQIPRSCFWSHLTESPCSTGQTDPTLPSQNTFYHLALGTHR